MNTETELKSQGWWRDGGWIVSEGYRRERNGTEMLLFNPDEKQWEWYPHAATTSYIYESFKTLAEALRKTK